MSHISICFAVYQNEGSLTLLYERVVHELKTYFPQHTYELLFVNDGSKDNSLMELLALRDMDPNVKNNLLFKKFRANGGYSCGVG